MRAAVPRCRSSRSPAGPILFAGVGEKPDDLEEFDPSRMAGRILGMGDVVGLVEKAQSVIDEKEAEAAAKKLQKGQFNFEDFLAQMNMIKKLGPLKKVLGMLPGVGAAMKDVDFDDKPHEAARGDDPVDDAARAAAPRRSWTCRAGAASPPARATTWRRSTG
jgi:signal recognition particle GTPase